jgi:pimeloyl-ACP methyl ester carboxylesterase
MTLRWDPVGERRGSALLLHGLMALSATWWRIGPSLAERGWQTTALDLPGHGRADRLNGRADLGALVSRLAAQMRGGVDLMVGHSLGAIAALGLAAHRPGIARALVLEDPAGFPGPGLRLLADDVESDAAAAAADRAALINLKRTANPRWADRDAAHSVDGVCAADVTAIAAALRTQLSWDLPAMIAAAPVPVLVLAAPNDGRSAMLGDWGKIRDLLPPERFVVIDGGHSLHRDRPAEWLDAVAAFTRESLPA